MLKTLSRYNNHSIRTLNKTEREIERKKERRERQKEGIIITCKQQRELNVSVNNKDS